MRAIIAKDRAAGIDGLELAHVAYPHAAENDVIVRVHAAGFTPGELDWPGTWTDRAGRERTPTIPGHEVSGVIAEMGYGTTGFTVGERVFGITDWCRNGTLAEFVAVEARNLATLSTGVGHVAAAALPVSGLTAWQGLFTHGGLEAGQTVLIHGAAGGVGSLAVQLARAAGARVIGTGRTMHRQAILGLGAEVFVDLDHEQLESIGEVDVVFDVFGGDLLDRSGALVRPGGALVSIAEPPRTRPDAARVVFFVVEPDRAGLAALEVRLREGLLRPLVGETYALEDAPGAFGPTRRGPGKPIIRVVDDDQPEAADR
ncbi:MAG: NADP-dependent oxidoreductase [Mycobacterium sp.]